MATVAAPLSGAEPFTPAHWSQRLPKSALDHIPGDDGWPLVGTTLKVLADPPAYGRRMYARYGPVFRTNSFGIRNVNLIGAEANELVLFDRQGIFSSEQGWSPVLHRLFPRGLMLLDFEKHRADRRALSIAFKPEPMRHYAGTLNREIARRVESWGSGPMRFYPAIKQLTLDLAADSFIGLPFGPEAERINQAFVDMVQASVAPVRKPLPFSRMKKGVDGRAFLVDYFTRETLRRRESGGGQDMFSQFATATDESGTLLPIDEVVDHMNFLMMAAHDTITSSATALVYLLARHPVWQDRVRDELLALTGTPGAPLSFDDLARPQLTEMAFKEALRMIPPVPSLPRRALRAFEFGGYHIPAGAPVSVSPAMVHHLEEHWPEPDRFDPERFLPEQVRARHKYAWVPFGGGAHMCLGLHFAYMQIKILMAHLLTRYRIEVADGYEPRWQAWPIPQPRDGLRIALRALN
ncbi:cytochrome P450 [Erythrobacteraceae bacterium CFH 75059]|uniref:cytochrome P450 n=1 Tax=Qipengyuania thermophila TaxID=2509361 RepID=UPI00101FE51E|nr:cytochrome P450 [Qipengyuania thermophila]TCD06399.1 cytochrome P450 [Erythrobacteraceae bacterium CFH 75059]